MSRGAEVWWEDPADRGGLADGCPRAVGLGETLLEARYDNGARDYLIGPGTGVTASVSIGTATWRAEEAIGSGTISVTDILPSFISGSFSVTLKRTTGLTRTPDARGDQRGSCA